MKRSTAIICAIIISLGIVLAGSAQNPPGGYGAAQSGVGASANTQVLVNSNGAVTGNAQFTYDGGNTVGIGVGTSGNTGILQVGGQVNGNGTINVGGGTGGIGQITLAGNGSLVTLSSPTSGVFASSGNAFRAPSYRTLTKCAAVGSAANPSVAACSAAPAGVFSCAVAGAGNCQVNTTTMIDANSTVLVWQDESTLTGTLLSVTCNTTPSVINPIITAKVAATSFSFSITTPVTNPDCFEYLIMN